MTRRRYAIKDVGFLRIYRDVGTDEYVVKPRGALTDAEAYFTSDLADAEGTARAWYVDVMQGVDRAMGDRQP